MRRRQRPQRSFVRQTGPPRRTDKNDLPTLDKPGDVRLFSTYRPSLEPGKYTIVVQQTLDIPGQQSPPAIQNTDSNGSPNSQVFTVQAPRWALEAKDVHSTYPPQGHADDPRILPHVVMNDPHLPWERSAGYDDDGLNQVPWMAVLVFEPDELVVDHTVLQGRTLKVSSTRAVSMTLQDLLNTTDTALPIDGSEQGLDKTVSTNVIFLNSSLFRSLNDLDPGTSRVNLQKYKYFAHVRNVNASGGAVAGVDDENGMYSIVFSHRTGPLSNTVPKTVVVHLVSLEGVRQNIDLTKPATNVALISLFNWQYQCLPPSSVDFPDQMRSLGLQAKMLRPLGYETATDPQLAARLSNGYSMVRHRLSTGETTVAFMRGPLSPVPVPYPNLAQRAGTDMDAGAWPMESFYSTDYQIFDAELGIMDISYATAWQVGRAMAMADRTFSQAIVGLRGEAHSMALAAAKAEYLSSKNSYKSRLDVLKSLPDLVQAFGDPSNLDSLLDPSIYEKRWTRTPGTYIGTSFKDLEIRKLYSKHLAQAMQKLTVRPSQTGTSGGFDIQGSSNWPIIVEWLLDRMKLVNLPSIYLINHPSNLPKESMRFFHIDQNWIAAQIDGALSIGNHISQPPKTRSTDVDFFDNVRQEIKTNFAAYIKNPPNTAAICPNGGFFMRSVVVKAFPDIIVQSGNSNTQVLSTSNLSEDVLVTWIRRPADTNPPPSTSPAIVIHLPPHQQRFALGHNLVTSSLSIAYNKVYTIPDDAPSGAWKPTGVEDTFHPSDANRIYDWGTRVILVQNLADRMLHVLKASVGVAGGFDLTTTLSSAVMALELNDPLYQLAFMEPTNPGEWASSEMYGSNFPQTATSTTGPPATASTTKVLDSAPLKPAPIPGILVSHGISDGDPPLTASHIRPPHIPACPRSPPFTVPAGPMAPPTPPGFTNCLKLDVFANEKQRNAKGLTTNSPYYLDIVFSVQPKTSNPGFQVQLITIGFPIGSPSPLTHLPGAAVTTILTQAYDGPGPTMLGNNRFNATLSSTITAGSGQKSLVITLAPRTASDVVVFDNNSDFSFVLREVAIDATTTGAVTFTLSERYTLPSGKPASVQTAWSVQKA